MNIYLDNFVKEVYTNITLQIKENRVNRMLEEVRSLSRPVNEAHVQMFIDDLEDNPSIASLEAVVKHYKEKLRTILTKDLLQWMQENDQVTFETDDMRVAIRTNVSTKVVDTETAFKWLEAHQYGDLIKDSLEFPKGEFSEEAKAALEALGLSYTQKSGIHPQSLKKIISDRLKAGEVLPEGEDDGISVGYFDECVVKDLS